MAKNETVERLAGGIAHDFDVLLTAIVGHAEHLSDYLSPGDPRASQVAAIRQAAEQASSLTQQLLAFSRTQTLRTTILDLNAVIARARHGLRRVLGDRIALETRPADRLWPVRADAEQFERILHSLAVNARDAMPGGGAVTLATSNVHIRPDDARARDVEPGDYVELTMTDTGAEIDSRVQPHLFEPFFGNTQRARGQGLGLAMVYGVVKQSGGHISVQSPLSADGRGSRFTVYLPATRDEAPRSSQDGRVDPESASETVLLMGDDRSVQAFIGDVLRRRGYRLLMANDAWHALRLADEHDSAIDLLIATGANGGAVADALQQQRPSTRVLYVSASAADAPGDSVHSDGAARAVLAQPFTPAALARKVRSMLTTDV
jgi:CheY-like chemotaxis protein